MKIPKIVLAGVVGFAFLIAISGQAFAWWNESEKKYPLAGYGDLYFPLDSEWIEPDSDINPESFTMKCMYMSGYMDYDNNSWALIGAWDFTDSYIYVGGTGHYLWHEQWYTFSDMVNDSAESGFYNITLIVTFYAGTTFNIADKYWFGIITSEGSTLMSDFYPGKSSSTSGAKGSFDHWETNPDTGLPWTKTDIDSLMFRTVIYKALSDTLTMKIYRVVLIAQPQETPESEIADFILRPNYDKAMGNESEGASNFTGYPDSYPLLHENINDTEFHGDAQTTLIHSNGTVGECFNQFYFDDLPSQIDYPSTMLQTFNVTVWVIAKTDDSTMSSTDYLHFAICNPVMNSTYLGFEVFNNFFGPTFTLSPSWQNYSYKFTYNPIINYYWTEEAINDLQLLILSSSSLGSYINITQVGIMVDFAPIVIVPSDLIDSEEIEKWQNGLVWILIIFLPAVALGTIAKIGFAGGALIASILVALIQPSFMPYFLICIIAIAGMMYKQTTD